MLTLCMIVKDEEEILGKCLESAKDLIDEIVIVDTGSTDKTKQIASQYTEKIFDFQWCNNFSAARNYSISKATNDWVLVLDADEVIQEFNRKSILEFCNKNNNVNVGRLKRINEYEDEQGLKRYIERVNRIFNKKYFNYEGIIHEQVVRKDRSLYSTKNIELVANHIGYSKEVINKTNKIQRNISLLKKALENNIMDPYLHYQLGKSYFMNKDYRNAYNSFKFALNFLDNFQYEYSEDLVESYGYTLINLGLFKEALVLHEYEKYYYNSPDFLFILALMEMNNSKFEAAIETFLKCTDFKEGKIEGITSYLPLYNIGVIFECLGLKNEALKYYKQCGIYNLAIKAINRIQN